MNLTEEKINSNYTLFVEKLKKTECDVESLLNDLGEKIKTAPSAPNVDSGAAYEGALVNISLFKIAKYAILINQQLPKKIQVDENSLLKVCLLHQISKAIMFEENDNTWEKTNRGFIYRYTELPGALRTGERSILICMKHGIKFTEEEYEAMRIIDKDNNDDNFAKYFSSPIATIVRQANELSSMETRITFKNKNNEK